MRLHSVIGARAESIQAHCRILIRDLEEDGRAADAMRVLRIYEHARHIRGLLAA